MSIILGEENWIYNDNIINYKFNWINEITLNFCISLFTVVSEMDCNSIIYHMGLVEIIYMIVVFDF